jgi:putative ABC transport system permease protein
MTLGEIVRTSLVEILHNKMRSALTLLGVILGTLSITVMTSFLDGVTNAVWQGISDLGYDGVLYVVPREARDLREQVTFSRSKGLAPADADLVLARGERIDAVSPVLEREEIARRGSEQRLVTVLGITPSYLGIRDRDLALGRPFTDIEADSYSRVCILGHRARQRFFGTEDPLGKSITIAGRSFFVVGVGPKLGNEHVNDSDFIEEMEGILIPLETMRKLFAGDSTPMSYMLARTGSMDRLGDAKAELVSSLRIAHHGADDFRVENVAEEMLRARSEITEVIGSWTIVLSSIAGIALLVGGIGLLSVMLISLGERLYEVGLRKALGASDFQIFIQFLLEAVILASIGGLLGAGAGVGIILLVSGFFPSGLPVNMGGLALAVGISITLGALYGVYPALKAARTPPVESLRAAG